MSGHTRLLVAALVLAAAIALLFTVVFPWVDRTFVTDPVLYTPGSTRR